MNTAHPPHPPIIAGPSVGRRGLTWSRSSPTGRGHGASRRTMPSCWPGSRCPLPSCSRSGPSSGSHPPGCTGPQPFSAQDEEIGGNSEIRLLKCAGFNHKACKSGGRKRQLEATCSQRFLLLFGCENRDKFQQWAPTRPRRRPARTSRRNQLERECWTAHRISSTVNFACSAPST